MKTNNNNTSGQSQADLISAFASSFAKNVQNTTELPQEEETELQDNFLSLGNRTEPAGIFDESVFIEEEPAAAPTVRTKQKPVAVPPPAPQLTEKQLKKEEKHRKKQEKWDKKNARRNAKIDRQQRNNTKIMLGGAIFLGIICIFLLVMNHFQLSFLDLPEILSGEKESTPVTTTMALAITDPSESGPTAPPKGNYTVTAEDGVYLRDSASASSTRVAVLEEGAKINVSAFKYDSEEGCFWGRTGINGTYGWVRMSNLTFDDTTTENVTDTENATIASLG